MRIQLWAPYYTWSLGRYCERAFKQLGHEVIVADFRRRSLVDGDAIGDLIFVIKGDMGVIPLLDKVNGKKALWFPDDPHGGGLPSALAPHFDYVFTAHKPHIPRYEASGAKAFWLPFACDPEFHKPLPMPVKHDFVFIGTMDASRKAFFDKLGQSFSVVARSGVFLRDMSRNYCSGRVGINVSKAGEITMRVFEVMACDVLLFTDSVQNNITELFTPGEHFIAYTQGTLSSLGEKYLSDEALRTKIAKSGGELVRSKHTYRDRMREVLQICFG